MMPAPAVSPAASLDLEDVVAALPLAARRIAAIDSATPLHRLTLPGGTPLAVKREDLSKVHSFKWRGAANAVAALVERGQRRPIVAASAGNHAQGIALAAAHSGLDAVIFMPRTTAVVKQTDVRRFGGRHVRVVLAGDTYNEACAEARGYAQREDASLVHAFDDPDVIVGQATIASELAVQTEPPDVVYIPIGGGGLAAGLGALELLWPGTALVGVESEGQASMSAAFREGRPVDIGRVDPFCEGTAVRTAGTLAYRLCCRALDRIVTVTNAEVCAAMEHLWSELRCVCEPAGALGMAAAMRENTSVGGDALTLITGANVDLALSRIVATYPRRG